MTSSWPRNFVLRWLSGAVALASCSSPEPPPDPPAASAIAGAPGVVGNGPGASGSAAGGLAGSGNGGAGAITSGMASGGVATGGSSANAAGAGALGGAAQGPAQLPGKPVLFVGGLGSEPLSVYDVDPESGSLSARAATFDAGPEPTYLALNPARTTLYVANTAGGATGGVTALHVNADASLTPLNHRQGSGGGYVHLMVTPDGKYLGAASYAGGNVSLFGLEQDGSIAVESSSMSFGSDARAHGVLFDFTGHYAFVPTNGTDQIQQLLVGTGGKLTANTPSSVSTGTGSGPRHLALHPQGQLAFLVNEQGSSVTSFKLADDGTLQTGATVSSVPVGFTGENTGAHVELSPDGHFVYVSNRGHDSIAVFSADQSDGTLTLVEHEPTRGTMPRDFDIDPNGQLLVAANMLDDTLTVFHLEADGKLTPRGQPVPTRHSPCAVQFHYAP